MTGHVRRRREPDNGAGRRPRIRRDTGWEQVWVGDGEGQASIVAGGLEARGIRTRVNGYQPLPGAYPTAWARSNWGIYVPGAQAAEARDHLLDSGEDANVVRARETLGREQLFVLKLAAAGLLALALASVIGVLFYGWGA
jgi:hypothetical protein